MKRFTFTVTIEGRSDGDPEEAFRDALEAIDPADFQPGDWVSYDVEDEPEDD